MEQPQLTVPITDQTANPATITETEALGDWIDNLPAANPLGTAKLLQNSLSSLNRHPGSLDNRLSLMRCYTPAYVNLVKAHIKHSKTQALGSRSKKELEQQTLTEKITTEMGYGFKRLIIESKYFAAQQFSPEEQAEIIYYTIEYLVLNLLFCYTDYRSDSKNIFKEIVQLYLLAERLNISQLEVDSRLHQASIPANIRLSFKRILLIQLMDPFHLQSGETWFAYDYLSWWAGHARIAKVPEVVDNATGRFIINLQGTEKPTAYTEDKVANSRHQYLLLDAIPLSSIVNKHLQSQSEKAPAEIPGFKKNPHIPASILFRDMLLAWHVNPERRHEREDQHDWFVAAAGLNQVHHFLSGKNLISSNRNSDQIEEESDEVEITGSFGTNSPFAHSTFRWRQLNVSASGAALVIHPEQKHNLQVGQILLMEDERGSNGAKAGIVRRLVKKDKNTLEAGIQYIQGRLTPARIRPVVFGVEERADFQPALYLDRGSSHKGVLFTPHMIYHHNQEYVTEFDDGETHRVFGDRLLETTRCYERFEFRVINLTADESH